MEAPAPVPGADKGITVFIDNFDSFTYNVVQYFQQLGANVRVFRNDAVTIEELDALAPARLVVSPGPGAPADAGISMDAIRHFAGKIPVLGVCLGHQAIVEVFGGAWWGPAESPPVEAAGDPACMTRLPADAPKDVPAPTRHDDDVIQGVRHEELSVEGVQFHPESIATQGGHAMFAAFLRRTSGKWES